MPVKLGSKLPPESAEARIEIIPLIDIMFFLLAAFMLLSLSMVSLKSVKVNLPTAATTTGDNRRDLINISVDAAGLAYLETKPVGGNELVSALAGRRKANDHVRVFIRGDKDARHGDVIRVLDLVRAAGIQEVAFETRAPTTK